MISIELPDALRPLVEGADRVQVEAGTVAGALEALSREYPQAALRILTRGGQLRPNVNLFVHESDIRSGDGLETRLEDGDSLLVVPSVAGG